MCKPSSIAGNQEKHLERKSPASTLEKVLVISLALAMFSGLYFAYQSSIDKTQKHATIKK